MAGSLHLENAQKLNHYKRYILIAMNSISFANDFKQAFDARAKSLKFPSLLTFFIHKYVYIAYSMQCTLCISVFILFSLCVSDVLNEASKVGTKSHRDKFIVEHLVPPTTTATIYGRFFPCLSRSITMSCLYNIEQLN